MSRSWRKSWLVPWVCGVVVTSACLSTGADVPADDPSAQVTQQEEENVASSQGPTPEGSDCADELLKTAASWVLRTLPEVGEARSRLRSGCRSSASQSFRLDRCSCQTLRQYLIDAEEVGVWRSQCCRQQEACERDALCAAGEMSDDQLVERLKESTQVAMGLMEASLMCFEEICVATESGCASSEACETDGLCGLTEEGRCAPTEKVHCQTSSACQKRGVCTLSEDDGQCVCDDDDPCGCTRDCLDYGRCATREDTDICEPATEAHCRQSRACAEKGYCDLGQRYDAFRGKTYVYCHSQVQTNIETARGELQRALESANKHPLRAALQLATEDTEVRARIGRAVDSSNVKVEYAWADVSVAFSDSRHENSEWLVDCEGFFDVARDSLEPRVLRQGEYKIVSELERARSRQITLYDQASDICWSNGGASRRPLSWVGPVWSVKSERWWSDGMGRGYVDRSLESYDVTTGEEASLDLVLEPDSIVAALRDDPWIAERLASVRIRAQEGDESREEERREAQAALDAFHSANTLSTIEEALAAVLRVSGRGAWESWDYSELFGGYVFFDYDPARGRVALRLELRDQRARPPEKPVTLGLSVVPRDEFLEDFERAHSQGWLQSNAAQLQMRVRDARIELGFSH